MNYRQLASWVFTAIAMQLRRKEYGMEKVEDFEKLANFLTQFLGVVATSACDNNEDG